jgi:hypothetical protein
MIYADELELYMLTLVNQERAAMGLGLLQLETNLNTAAEDHSEWILDTNTFSHTGINNTTALSTYRILPKRSHPPFPRGLQLARDIVPNAVSI